MAVYLKNVKNGEVRSVEAESDEFFDLTRQVFDPGDGTARPTWEQQGFHSKDNSPPIAAGENSGLADAGPELEPHKNLTPGEREAGLSSWEDKERQLEEQRNAEAAVFAGARRQVPGDPGEFSRGEGETSGDPGGSGSGTPPKQDVTERSSTRRSGRKASASAEQGES